MDFFLKHKTVARDLEYSSACVIISIYTSGSQPLGRDLSGVTYQITYVLVVYVTIHSSRKITLTK